MLTDKGLAAREIEAQIAALGLRMVRPNRREERTLYANNLGSVRCGSNRSTTPSRASSGRKPRRPNPHGAFTRVAQRLLALAAAIWHNWAIGARDKRSLIAYDQ